MRSGASGDDEAELEPWLEALVREAVGVEASPPRALPAVVGDFELTEVLGRGGLGVVYGARDLRLGRQVAIKALRTDRLLTPAHAEREARALAALRHPGVVAIYGLHEAASPGGEPELLLVMERVDGRTLAEVLAGGGGGANAPRWSAELLDAMVHAHGRRIVHGDLKPGNLMVEADGRLRVLDFGLARRAGEGPWLRGGTPGYMAPEQARGEVTPRSDVYALGLILRELRAAGGRERRGAPGREAVIARALAPEPAARFADARALAEAWGRAVARDRRRARRPLGLAAAALAAGAAVAAARLLGPASGPPPRRWVAELWLDRAPRDRLKDIAVSADGRHVAWLDQHGNVAVAPFETRRARTDEARQVPLGAGDRATALAWAPDGALLVASSLPGLRAWRQQDGAWSDVGAPAGPPAASLDGGLVLVTDRAARLVHAVAPGGRVALPFPAGVQLLSS